MDITGKRVLITGGHGFLGQKLCLRLKRNGAIVRAPKHEECDLTDRSQLFRLFEKWSPEIVIHAAGYLGGINFSRTFPADVFVKNLSMACSVIEACKVFEPEKLVTIGSACVYSDDIPGPFKESQMLTMPMHESVQYYGFSKQALYFGGKALQEQSNIKVAHLIPANLYGPGDKFDPQMSHVISSLIPKFCKAKRENLPTVDCWGTGETIREFLYVDDCADAVLEATKKYFGSTPLNLGVGYGIKIKDVAEMIKKVTSFRGDIVWDKSKPDGASYKVIDSSRARHQLSWEPKTGLEAGINKTVADFEKNYETWIKKQAEVV